MKIVSIALLFVLVSCGPESSPDGRSRLRDEKIQVQIDHLKYQQLDMLDTINKMRHEMEMLKSSR